MRIKEIKIVYPDKIGIYPAASGTIPTFPKEHFVSSGKVIAFLQMLTAIATIYDLQNEHSTKI